MSNKINLVFIDKLLGNDPRGVLYDFIDPFAVPQGLIALRLGEDCVALVSFCCGITADSNYESAIRE